MKSKTLGKIQRISRVAGFDGKVTDENVKDVLIALAENFPRSLSREIDMTFRRGARCLENYHNTANDLYLELADETRRMAEEILSVLGITVDYPGLYPTFFVIRNGETYNESSSLSAINRLNGMWD